MENKKKYYTGILAQVMCRHGISVADITEALKNIPVEEQLDYAVMKNGKILRVPVSDESANLDVRGVFPSKDSPKYLELGESDVVLMTKKAKEEVPSDEEFWELAKIIDPLNDAIVKAGGLPLTEWYHTVVDYGGVRNDYPHHIVEVKPGKLNFEASFEGDLKAKIRRFIKP